ncbi:MAG: succinate dehydrogenase cytochrome b subunit [Planctomycetota bacterium]
MGRFLDSSLGRKFIMALTGLLLTGFLVMHLLGNLSLFAGKDGEAFITYAEKLHDLGPLLVVSELALLALFAIHVGMAVRLTILNREARPVRYQVKRTFGESTPSSASMFVTGSIVLGFLVVHLATMRFADGLSALRGEKLHGQVVSVLENPILALIYLAGSIAVGVHLAHGFRSLFQSLGANHGRINRGARALGWGLAILFAIGFAAFPLAGLFGFWRGEG